MQHALRPQPYKSLSLMPEPSLRLRRGTRFDQTSRFFSGAKRRYSKRKKVVTCQWPRCSNAATTVLYRQTTAEERAETTVSTARGISWAQFVELRVCRDHISQARHEYPHVANKEP